MAVMGSDCEAASNVKHKPNAYGSRLLPTCGELAVVSRSGVLLHLRCCDIGWNTRQRLTQHDTSQKPGRDATAGRYRDTV